MCDEGKRRSTGGGGMVEEVTEGKNMSPVEHTHMKCVMKPVTAH